MGQMGDLPKRGIWQQSSDDLGFKWLLIWLLNDSLYIMMILFPAQLIEYTGWGVGGGSYGEELMHCDEGPNWISITE